MYNVQYSLSDGLNLYTLSSTRYSQYLTGSFRYIISPIKTLSALRILYITNHQMPLIFTQLSGRIFTQLSGRIFTQLSGRIFTQLSGRIFTQLSGRIFPLHSLWTLNNKINCSQVK